MVLSISECALHFVYEHGDCSLLILPTMLSHLASLRQDARKPWVAIHLFFPIDFHNSTMI